jgi:hypothetical protein
MASSSTFVSNASTSPILADSCKSPSKSRKPMRRNVSSVWEYFEAKESFHFCKYQNCTTKYSKGTSTTNMIYHLKNSHQIDLVIEPQSSSEEEEEITSNQNKVASNAKYGPVGQAKLNDLFIKFVVSDLQAFNIATSKPFLEFIYALNPKYNVPDRKTLSELINKKYEEKKKEIQHVVQKCSSKLSFTTDSWSSIQCDPYLSLTVHYIDDNFNYKKLLLDFLDFPHPHDQFNISETIFEVNF